MKKLIPPVIALSFIDSTYDKETGAYTGTVSVQSVKGNFSTEVMCQVL